MSLILAALDSTPAAQSVLEAALKVGEMTHTDVEAVHVPMADDRSVQLRTDRAHVPLRLLSGPLEPALLTAIEAPSTLVAVIGAKAVTDHKRVIGTTARHIIERSTKPVVIVPPEFVLPGAFRRLLIPLEGTESSSRPVVEGLLPLLAAHVELIVLHVFTESTRRVMPRPSLARPGDDGKRVPHSTPPPARGGHRAPAGSGGHSGRPGATEQRAGLIVLSWSQDSAAGRAHVVRGGPRQRELPILLLSPFRREGSGRTQDPGWIARTANGDDKGRPTGLIRPSRIGTLSLR